MKRAHVFRSFLLKSRNFACQNAWTTHIPQRTLHQSSPNWKPSTATVQEQNKKTKGRVDTAEAALSFDDPRVAYRCKTTRELLRAYFVFRLCGVGFLVDHQYTVRLVHTADALYFCGDRWILFSTVLTDRIGS